jgi:hypothetical protein
MSSTGWSPPRSSWRGLEKFLFAENRNGSPIAGVRNADGSLNTAPWDRFLARMFAENKIPKEVVEAVQATWAEFEKLLPDTKATFRATEGYDMDTLEHRPMQTPFGELAGGYVPAQVDNESEQQPRTADLLENMEAQREAFRYSVSAGKGHTITRNPNFHKKLVLDPSRLAGAISNHIRYVYLQQPAKNVQRLLRDPAIAAAVNGYDSQAINHIALPWLDNTVRQSVQKPSRLRVLDATASWLRAAGGLVALGFNFMNAVFQVTGLSNATTVVKPRYMLAALASTTRNPVAAYRSAAEQSPAFEQLQSVVTRKLKVVTWP